MLIRFLWIYSWLVLAPALAGEARAADVSPPNVHPHKLVLELSPGTPRPGHGHVERPNARPERLSSSGIAALDAVHARYQPLVFEPLFPTAVPPPFGSDDEDLTRFYVIELPATAILSDALADYAAVPGVASAEPVPVAGLSYVPNDPRVADQWQLGQPNDRDSDVFEAWDLVRGDSSIVIAILDTGVLYSHEDMGGSAPPYTDGNIAHNWIEMGGVAGVDDDANGFVDDFRGWDFVTAGAGVPGEDVSGADNNPIDFAGHGTYCAGMASARTDNGVGIAGTGFRARILPLRIGYKDAASSPGQIDMSWAAQAIVYAANNGAHVINCSWESYSLSALGSAVTYALSRGVTIVVAAGNANTETPSQNYLASRGDCIDVGAIDSNDVRAGFSNFGTWVDVSAAGLSVTSTWGGASVASYLTSSGTSVAAPFVAGAVGLYQAYRKSLGLPLATPTENRLRVRDTGDNIDALNPSYAGRMGTRVNVHRLLTDPYTLSWENVGTGGFTTSPAIADLDGDGQAEVIIGGSDQRVIAVTGAQGDTLPGFPVLLTGAIYSNPATWDVDLDGLPEILVGTTEGLLYAIKGNGTMAPGYPIVLSGDLRAGPAIADIDRAHPGLELAIGSSDGKLWVLDRTGAIRPGWPQQARSGIYAVPALHDFDGDGGAEVVVGSLDSTLYGFHGDGTPMAGWPITLPNRIESSAAIGDVDHDGAADIIVGCNDQNVYGLRSNGTPMTGWPVSVMGAARSSPALADLAGNDGLLEVAIASDGMRLYVIDGGGNVVAGWPVTLGGRVSGGVIVADVDGDGALEVLAGTTDKKLNVYSESGQSKPGWPRLYDGVISGTPSVGDPDVDDRTEIIFGTSTRTLRAVDMGAGSWSSSPAPWPTLHRDYFRRGSTSALVVGVPVDDGMAGVRTLAFHAQPNPSVAPIRFVLRRPGSTPVDEARGSDGVRIYSVTGQKVRDLPITSSPGNDLVLNWDGTDEQGRRVATGLYFAHARWRGVEARLRLVRLR